ncbi:helix-turn-helix transcriptional regulator [Oscillospiraceae bacterium N12]|jgi:transcriptional regulator with XRE-family HTH domain|uniref:Helix-turn-helix transcriptional regulator n=1 Tax=Jilunia laotingensis TaxID=2763675 RepID=A0A926IP48_9BACT|nr:helix-turn-helix transcriptional regulator [Jilunia laotingensis]MBC8592381.1 helix-turn-helix transcriptional regulator [Jilunia laotingensis]
METEEKINSNVHHGHNIRRTRIEKNMNQDILSEKVSMSQPTVSRYESMRIIEDDILERFAKALNVPKDYLKTLEEDAPSIVFENNSITNNGGNNTQAGLNDEISNDNRITNNPIDKITELYERLLKDKDDMIAELQQHIDFLEGKNNKQ